MIQRKSARCRTVTCLPALFPAACAACFAAALAKVKNAPLVTGDPELRRLGPEEGVQIEWLAG